MEIPCCANLSHGTWGWDGQYARAWYTMRCTLGDVVRSLVYCGMYHSVLYGTWRGEEEGYLLPIQARKVTGSSLLLNRCSGEGGRTNPHRPLTSKGRRATSTCCADWSLYPRGVKTGELVHTSQSQAKIYRRWVYNRTTTPECSEDRTAVPSVMKTEREPFVYLHNMCPHSTHTHLKDYKAAWQNPQTLNTCTSPLLEKNQKFYIFVRNPSIGQQLSQQTQHHTPSLELHYHGVR